jgi:hypothetical protein
MVVLARFNVNAVKNNCTSKLSMEAVIKSLSPFELPLR